MEEKFDKTRANMLSATDVVTDSSINPTITVDEFEIVRANMLPAADVVTDNDMILVIQGGRPKRALPSSMKGEKGDKLTYADLTGSDKENLQQPAIEAANTAKKAAENALASGEKAEAAAEKANQAAEGVKDGKTPVFKNGTTSTGLAGTDASIAIVLIGNDENGNPIYETSANIPRGETGRSGKDFQILGFYDSILDLRNAVPTPEPGDAFGIGTSAPYPIYIWDAVSEDWVNNGAIQGPAGRSGKSVRVNRETGYWQEFNDETQTWSDTDYIAQYTVATADKDGLLSQKDKKKIDGIAEGANKYVHPTFTPGTSGLYKITVNIEGHVSEITAVTKKDITDLGIPGQDTDTTYNVATTGTNGLMSSTDKKRSDVIWGSVTASSLSNLPTTGRYVYCERSSSSTVSLNGSMEVGQELHIVLYNTSSTPFTQTLPNTGYFKSLSGTSIVVPGYGTLEINILCYKSGYYLIRAMAA